VSWLVVRGTYRLVERIFLGASLFYAVYLISAVLAAPNWPAVVRQTVRPALLIERDYVAMLITLVGTTIAPWMQFYIQASIVDKGVRRKEYGYVKIDVWFGSIVASAVAFFIIVACGATLHAHGVRIDTAEQAAMALEPFAGHYASLLFALGLLNASLFSAAIVPLSTAYAVCEGFGWQTGVDRTLREAPGFFSIYLSIVAAGALLILWPKAPLITIMFLSQTLNGILLPFVLIFMLLLINDPAIMGARVNSPAYNLIAWGTAALMIALTLLLIVTTIL
jgi:Mn2+/Fe2+ NRAMP family transporter